MKKAFKIVLICMFTLVFAGIIITIGKNKMNMARRANSNERAGIMPQEDWYTLEQLTNKYGHDRKMISEQDFDTLMTLIKKGAVEPGKDNIKNSAHLGSFVGILASVDMTDAQKAVVAEAMKEAFQQPNTEPSQNQIKFFALFVMDSIKNDGLVKEALPYENDKDMMTRTMVNKYLKTVGYKH